QLAPHAIASSAGPCTTAEAGIPGELVRETGSRPPILGVCLGHQAIGAAYGGSVVRGKRLMHGKTSSVAHRGEGIFSMVPTPFTVARYHSLVIEPSTLPEELEIVAWTDEEGFEDEIQAVRHRAYPVWGVQFHPESIASEHGHTLLRNFLSLI